MQRAAALATGLALSTRKEGFKHTHTHAHSCLTHHYDFMHATLLLACQASFPKELKHPCILSIFHITLNKFCHLCDMFGALC